MDETEGFEFEYEPGDEPVIPESVELPKDPDIPDEEQLETDAPKTEYVPKEKFDEVMSALAEMRGRMAALTEQGQRIPATEPPKPADNTAGVAALKARLKNIAQKMYDPDTAEEGLQEFLEVSAIINRAQAQQDMEKYTGPSINAAADLVIENFMGRMERKDDLYEKVEPLLNDALKKVDKSAVARMPREQVLEALDQMYKAARGEVLGKMYEDSKVKKARRTAAAPNLGGSRNNAPTADAKQERISKAQRELALAAGFKEDEIADIFKEEGNDEW